MEYTEEQIAEAMEVLKYMNNETPLCPHCDHEIDISENDMWNLLEEATHDVECPNCGGDIIVESQAKWTFTTEKADD